MKNTETIWVGETEWRVIGRGASVDGATFVHLAAVSKGAVQRNGFRPAQVCGWLRGSELRDRP